MPDPITLLLTRPQAQSDRFAAEVASALPDRFQPLIAPLLRIRALPAPALSAAPDAVLFTSENAVQCWAAQVADRRPTALCVGDRTADAARQAGFTALSAAGRGPDLMRLARAHLPPGGRVVHPRGRHVAWDLAAGLRAAGFAVDDPVIYDQVAVPTVKAVRSTLAGADRVAVPLFSPRSARLFADAFGAFARPHWTLVCLSPAVADVLPMIPAALEIADHPDAGAMIAALGRLV